MCDEGAAEPEPEFEGCFGACSSKGKLLAGDSR